MLTEDDNLSNGFSLRLILAAHTSTLFAAVKLSPVPPASVEIKKMKTSGSLLNLSIIGMPAFLSNDVMEDRGFYSRSDCLVFPSNRQNLKAGKESKHWFRCFLDMVPYNAVSGDIPGSRAV